MPIEGSMFLIGYMAGIIMGLFVGYLLFTEPKKEDEK